MDEAERLRGLDTIQVVLRDPHALLDLLWECRDAADARARIADRYGVAAESAQPVLDLALARLTTTGRARLDEEREALHGRAT